MICNVLFFVILIIEVYSLDNPYEEKTFRCNNGKYIPGRYFCPNKKNISRDELEEKIFIRVFRVETSHRPTTLACEDESHQSYGCDTQECEFGQFKCSNGTCLNINSRCNTINECSDGSDEFDCGDEVQVNNCLFTDGKFLCYDKLRCLDSEYACNKECNCFDCSDENENCTKDYSEEIKDCPHHYFKTPDGPKCYCDPNDPKLNNLCKDVKPCEKWNPCDQKCYQYKNKITCSCYDNNYVAVSDEFGFVCKNKVNYENLLIYTTSNQIKVINASSAENIFTKKKVQTGVIAGAGDHLYYTTYDNSDRKTIYKTSIKSGVTESVIKSNSSIISIAIDYITNNLYFTTNTSLSVCSNDGTICTQLKCCNIRYVALAPKSGLMFYMEKSEFQDERFIMKSAMDGSDEDYFVDGSFRYFSLLAADESTRRLYWMQQEENEIWSYSYDNSYKEPRLIKYHGSLVAFTIFENEFLFTKLRDNEIYRLRKIERYTGVLKNSVHDRIYSFGSPIIHGDMFASNEGPHIVHTLPNSKPGIRTRSWTPSSEYDPFSYFTSSVLSLELMALSDYNATRFIDGNVTFAIKYVYAYNPLIQSFSRLQNPCAKASCDGLCLLRPPASKNDSSNFVCANEYSISTKSEILSNPSSSHRNDSAVAEMYTEARKNGSYFSKDEPQTYAVFILTVVGLLAFLLLVLVGYLAFAKRYWPEYYDRLRNWRSAKSNENVNICDQVEL